MSLLAWKLYVMAKLPGQAPCAALATVEHTLPEVFHPQGGIIGTPFWLLPDPGLDDFPDED